MCPGKQLQLSRQWLSLPQAPFPEAWLKAHWQPLHAGSEHAPGCTGDLSSDTPREAVYDVQRHPEQGDPASLQEVHAGCE